MMLLALFVSKTEKPQLLTANTVEKMVQARGSPVITPSLNMPVDPHFRLVAWADMSKDPAGNEIVMLEALTVALHCLNHDEWYSEVSVDGRVAELLDMVLRASIDTLIDGVTERIADCGEFATQLIRAATEEASRLVNCDCMQERTTHFDQFMRTHRPVKRTDLN